MKILKKVLASILIILLIYGLFIFEEVMRISIRKGSKPLIVLKEEDTYDGATYHSIGYKLINNYYHKSNDLVIVNGQEIWIFDIFMIWGWIS